MISDRDLVCLQMRGSPYSTTTTRAAAEQYLAERERWPEAMRRGVYDVTPVPSCLCCGEPAWENRRCTKHQTRNPCVVEGCRWTVKASRGELADDQAICGTHWRAYVPPGSRTRRAYNAHFRRAKRLGRGRYYWTAETVEAFERFWTLLVRRVRRLSTEGSLDEAAIHRLFGWDEP